MVSSWLSSHWASACTDWLCSTAGEDGGMLGTCHRLSPSPWHRVAPCPPPPALPGPTYRSGRWPSWPGPGWPVPGGPGGQGRGGGRGKGTWCWAARGAAWAGVGGCGAGGAAGRWMELGRSLQRGGEEQGQRLATLPTGFSSRALVSAALLSPSLPLCPAEAQCRSLMDSTGRRLMAPGSAPSGSAGSGGAAPSALLAPSGRSRGRGERSLGTPMGTRSPPPAHVPFWG